MIAKIFLALCLVACAQGTESGLESCVSTLKLGTEEAGRRILETLAAVNKVDEDFDEMTSERLESVLWECTVQKTTVNKTVTDALFKGMMKNKLFPSFQCIYSGSDEAFRKIEEVKSKISENSRKIKGKGLARIKPIGLILPGLYDFVQELHNKKSEDLNKANEEGRLAIMKEVEGKLNLLKAILQRVNELVKELKYKFLDEHIEFTFQTGNNLKKIQREGSQKIMKCVA